MILHICVLEKFMAPFVSFARERFPDFDKRHRVYVNNLINSHYPLPDGPNITPAKNMRRLERYRWLIKQMNQAEKIILHGLNDYRVLQLLAIQPWLLKKCYWIIWGSDLYTYQLDKRTPHWRKIEIIRRFIIKRLGHFITYIRGDYELARRWYGAKGQWHECFAYPSNLYKKYDLAPTAHDSINILVGNSADSSNNHLEVLNKLRIYANENIRIYCPLSYGDKAGYADNVEVYGRSFFGDKFISLRDFIGFDEYLALLAKIDIAIFNHQRQQGMGNIITLLGLGKKVYLRSDVTSWQTFEHLGIQVYDVADMNLTAIAPDIAEKNNIFVARYFSETTLEKQWSEIFYGPPSAHED